MTLSKPTVRYLPTLTEVVRPPEGALPAQVHCDVSDSAVAASEWEPEPIDLELLERHLCEGLEHLVQDELEKFALHLRGQVKEWVRQEIERHKPSDLRFERD